MSTIPFANFTKGVLSRELQARIDTSQYGSAVRKANNFIIQRYGGLSLRPGFRLVAEVDDATKDTRYIPFQYNIEQSYVVALEDQRMRLLASGGHVIEQNLKITAISKEFTPLVSVAFHDYVVGDRIYFYGIVGMTQLNGQYAVITAVPSTGTFRVSINTTDYGTFVSSDGDIRVGTPVAPPAPSPPPTPPPAPPAPAPTTGGGGSGGSTGDVPGWTPAEGPSGGKEVY